MVYGRVEESLHSVKSCRRYIKGLRAGDDMMMINESVPAECHFLRIHHPVSNQLCDPKGQHHAAEL